MKAGHCTRAMAISEITDDRRGDRHRIDHVADAWPARCASQMGSLRKIGRGMCRSTIITYRNAPGAQTSSLPLADAVTASSATYSLSTVNGASLAPVAFQCSIVVVVRTWPGPDHQHANTVLAQCFSESEVEAVEAGLGGPVDEVGPPHPLTGRRAHRDDLAEALRAHLLAEQHADRNRCGVVDLGDLHGLALVLPQLLGVAEQAERDDRHVDIAPPPKAVSITLGWLSVSTPSKSIHSTDLAPAAFICATASSLPGSSGRAASTMRAVRVAQVALADGQPDLGRAAEQQDGLGVSYGVEAPFTAAPNVGPCRRRRRRSGSTLRRTAIHSSMRGYMAWKVSALMRESLAV